MDSHRNRPHTCVYQNQDALDGHPSQIPKYTLLHEQWVPHYGISQQKLVLWMNHQVNQLCMVTSEYAHFQFQADNLHHCPN